MADYTIEIPEIDESLLPFAFSSLCNCCRTILPYARM